MGSYANSSEMQYLQYKLTGLDIKALHADRETNAHLQTKNRQHYQVLVLLSCCGRFGILISFLLES